MTHSLGYHYACLMSGHTEVPAVFAHALTPRQDLGGMSYPTFPLALSFVGGRVFKGLCHVAAKCTYLGAALSLQQHVLMLIGSWELCPSAFCLPISETMVMTPVQHL